MGGEMVCQPVQRLRSSWGSRDLAIMTPISSMPRQSCAGELVDPTLCDEAAEDGAPELCGLAGRQYFPLPYMPSREAATWVRSATSLGSVGEPLRRSSMNLRARS